MDFGVINGHKVLFCCWYLFVHFMSAFIVLSVSLVPYCHWWNVEGKFDQWT